LKPPPPGSGSKHAPPNTKEGMDGAEPHPKLTSDGS
jgi:hypothetical protein